MIDIKYKDKVLVRVPITSKCIHRKEVMKDNYIRLSWESSELVALPVSSSIVFQGSKYSLLTDYIPNEVEEGKYVYEPLFRSENMLLSKKIFIYKDVDKTPETEWSLTADIDTFAKVVVDAIKYTTDRDITVNIDANIAGIKSIDFSNTDILSGLNKIADEYDTEWWFNGDVLNISKCEWGDTIELKVGDNINAPRIDRKQEQITRFIAFGSDRNITQDYKPSTNLVNYKNRLTLPKDKYPNGYIDIKDDLSVEEILPKVFVFDNIYPSSKLAISNVKSVLKYVYDTEGNKVEIGKDEEGNPLYDTYFVFTFEIPDFDFDVDSIIPNEELKGSFTSGKLIGMTFLLAYKDGVYTIKPNQENLPNVYYNPEDGDGIILINIDMPQEYVNSAEKELEQAVLKEIEKTKQDYNTYSFNTDRTTNQDDVLVGRKVKYINKGYELETRIISIEAKLDNYNDKSVVIGNDTIKSPFEELREDIYDASRNVDVVKALNEATSTIQNSMIQGQREFLENLEKWGKLWTLRKDGETIHTVFDAFVQGGITMYSDDLGEASPSMFDAFPHDGKTIKRRSDGVYYAVGGGNGGTGLSEITIKVNDVEYESEDGFVQLPNYPTKTSDLTNDLGFTTEKWVNSQGFLVNEDLKDYATQSWSNNKFALKSHNHNWTDITNTPTTLVGYGITDAYTKSQSNTKFLGIGDNAVSASKLLNTRKIWGQSFDGTQDVSGDLHMNGHIYNHINNKGWTLYTSGEDKDFHLTMRNGNSYKYNRIYISNNTGYVSIGKNTASELLDVNGNVKANDYKSGDGIMSFDKLWRFNKGLTTRGGITVYSDTDVNEPTLFDSFPHDNKTIKRRSDGVYYAVVGEGGLSSFSVKVGDNKYDSVDGVVSLPSYPTRVSQLANDVGYLTKHQDLSEYAKTSQIPTKVGQLDNDKGYVDSSVVNGYAKEDWVNSRFALKSHKHNWSDITNTPTTLDGYGITDGVVNLNNEPNSELPKHGAIIGYYTPKQGYPIYGGLVRLSYRSGYGMELIGSNLSDKLMYRGLTPNADQEWRDVAFTDSNVASASKLLNTRKIWGQSFDGTKNIDGDLTVDNGSVTVNRKQGRSTLNIISKTDNPIDIWLGSNDEKHWSLTSRASNENNRLMLYNSGGGFALSVRKDNNFVGVGIDAPTEAMHVGGNVKADRFIGIADSATKLQTSRKIWGQNFDGTKNISGDFINGDGIISFNKHWNFNKDIVSQGGVTMYGAKGVSLPTLFDAFPHDNVTIKRRADGVYYAVGGSGGLSEVSVSVNNKEYLPDSNGKITIPNYPSRLSHLTNDVGYTTQQWVDSQKYAKVSQLPTRVSQLDNDSGYVTSSVVDGYATQSWSNSRFALKSHKHNWNDITSTPTTLDKYGITDAVTLNTTQTISGIKSFNNNIVLFETNGWEYRGVGFRLLTSFNTSESVGNYHAGVHFGNTYSSFQLASSATGKSVLKFRGQETGRGWKDWKTIAFTDSNVASATKLKTPRKIWGQSFNGEKDVEGDFTIEDGSVTINRKTGRSTLNLISQSDEPNDIWFGSNGSKHWSLTSRASNENNRLMLYNNGGGFALSVRKDNNFVGVGIGAPTEAMHVGGNVKADRFIGIADSATKLQTSRKIWGQSFDGTQDVGGVIHGATRINSSDGLYILSENGRATIENVSKHDHPNDLWLGSNSVKHWSITSRGSSEENRLRLYNNDVGDALAILKSNNYVGFNVSNPTERVHVGGSVRIDGNIVGVTKIILKGGKEIYYDSAKNAIIIDGDVLATGAVTMFAKK